MQALALVSPLRDFFLVDQRHEAYAAAPVFLQPKKCFHEHCCRYATPLALQFGQLLKRMWNPRNFKGQVHHIPKIKIETSKISLKAHP